MPEIGETLREARIRKGLSLKDMEEQTKIRSKYLQALEEDDFEVIPGATFVKGFLRTYGDFLGLDGLGLVDEYRARFEPRQDPHPFPRRTGKRGPRRRGHSSHRQTSYMLVGVLAVVVVVLFAWLGWGRGGGPAALDPQVTRTTQVEGITAETIGSSEPSTTAGTGTTQSTVATSVTSGAGGTGPVTLVVKAKARCWLVVREGDAGGRILFSGTMSIGQEITEQADQALWLNVGNPPALQATVNGKAATIPEPYGDFLVDAGGVRRAE